MAVLAALAATLSLALLVGGGVVMQGSVAALAVFLFVVAAWRYGLDGAERSFLKSALSQPAGTIMGHG
jgi:hypothetical protein